MKRLGMPLLAFVLLVGCRGSQVHETLETTLAAGQGHSFMVDAPRKQQKIRVVMTADEPINVWIILDKDMGDEINPEAIKDKILASDKATKNATLTATIPAKETFRVYIDGGKKSTKVVVKIDSL